MLNKERKNLRKLKKTELLEIMLAQSEEIEALKNQLAAAEEKLADREIILEESGSLAEASLKLTNIFAEAQKAADLYLNNIKARLGEEDGKADRS
ncbi:DNA repair protein [Streptococcus sp. H49]|uniref:DNA repair protein n=1 Tax=Streptococcus huangxiaojuni TaxID=3237239 RepID=UPI0034A3F7AA